MLCVVLLFKYQQVIIIQHIGLTSSDGYIMRHISALSAYLNFYCGFVLKATCQHNSGLHSFIRNRRKSTSHSSIILKFYFSLCNGQRYDGIYLRVDRYILCCIHYMMYCMWYIEIARIWHTVQSLNHNSLLSVCGAMELYAPEL